MALCAQHGILLNHDQIQWTTRPTWPSVPNMAFHSATEKRYKNQNSTQTASAGLTVHLRYGTREANEKPEKKKSKKKPTEEKYKKKKKM